MADVVIGNVILTAALAIGLILFISAAQGFSLIYSIRAQDTLVQGDVDAVAQEIQQVYLIVNQSLFPPGTTYVLKNLGLPNQLLGFPYRISLELSQVTAREHELLVTISLIGAQGKASTSVILGENIQLLSTGAVQGSTTTSLVAYKCGSGGGSVVIGGNTYPCTNPSFVEMSL